MKGLGVPLLAIYQKMEMDGLQKEWLLKPELIPMENINDNDNSFLINNSMAETSDEIPKITSDMLSMYL